MPLVHSRAFLEVQWDRRRWEGNADNHRRWEDWRKLLEELQSWQRRVLGSWVNSQVPVASLRSLSPARTVGQISHQDIHERDWALTYTIG